ncbi:TetR family transcriptional regulator C-terminal domain-containing protein [Pendulispora brunnea]|uniref:TetR family transcriptional regulator C-terminal domain-containing protein n=2 Tax=Pendulispora brunnea TaxID=2905690 RepID=A0ABZ2KDD2_9BACT
MIEHAQEYRPLVRVLIGKRSGQVVQNRFRKLIVELVQEDLAGFAPAGPPRDAMVHYIAGAFLELLAWWLDTRTLLDASELEELFHRFTKPILHRWVPGTRNGTKIR